MKTTLKYNLEQFKSRLLSKKDSDQTLKKVTNSENSNIFSGMQGHPNITLIDPGNEFIYSITQTHIRLKNSPHLPKMNLENVSEPSKGISQLIQKNQINNQKEAQELLLRFPSGQLEIQKIINHEKGILITLDKTLLNKYKNYLNKENYELLFLYLDPTSRFNKENNELVQHNCLTISKFMLLDSSASQKNIQDMLVALHEYYSIRCDYSFQNDQIIQEFEKVSFFYKHLLPIVSYIHPQKGENENVYNQEIALIKALTYNLKYNLKQREGNIKSALDVEFSTISWCKKNKSEDEIKQEFSNYNIIKNHPYQPITKAEEFPLSSFLHFSKNLDAAINHANKKTKTETNNIIIDNDLD